VFGITQKYNNKIWRAYL